MARRTRKSTKGLKYLNRSPEEAEKMRAKKIAKQIKSLDNFSLGNKERTERGFE